MNNAWINFITGDPWPAGAMIDVIMSNGNKHLNIQSDGIVNIDSVLKYRYHQVQDVDPVVDPKSRYYDAGGIETIDVIKAKLTPEQLTGYLLGNVIKYSCRLNFKGSADRDAEKLKFYSQWLNDLTNNKTV